MSLFIVVLSVYTTASRIVLKYFASGHGPTHFVVKCTCSRLPSVATTDEKGDAVTKTVRRGQRSVDAQ